MATYISTEMLERFWRKAQVWFAKLFASNTQSVTEKVDDAKEEILAAIDENAVESISSEEIHSLFTNNAEP